MEEGGGRRRKEKAIGSKRFGLGIHLIVAFNTALLLSSLKISQVLINMLGNLSLESSMCFYVFLLMHLFQHNFMWLVHGIIGFMV